MSGHLGNIHVGKLISREQLSLDRSNFGRASLNIGASNNCGIEPNTALGEFLLKAPNIMTLSPCRNRGIVWCADATGAISGRRLGGIVWGLSPEWSGKPENMERIFLETSFLKPVSGTLFLAGPTLGG